jgi:di/tricarboxylate transporter
MLLDGFWQDIVEVTSGRGQLRLIVQPLMAVLVGVKLGLVDAHAGKQPFLWRLAKSSQRKRLVARAFKSVVVPFSIAVVVDGVLQYLTHGYVRPVAALVMGAVLVFAPFLIARSLTNRVYRRTHVAALGH